MNAQRTSRRILWASITCASAFVLYGLFFYVSQQRLLKDITRAKLASVEAHANDRARDEGLRLHNKAASMSATIAKLAAGQLENSQSFRLLKDGMAQTLEPFMAYSEIAAIEITDKANQPYAAIWKSAGQSVFRVNYSMPPAFREQYKLVVKTPSVANGDTQGFVTVYVDDQANARQTALLMASLRTAADGEIAMLQENFQRTLAPQVLVLLGGLAFVAFSGLAISRYGAIETQRRELAAFNQRLEQKVQERTQALEDAALQNLAINRDLRASQDELLETIDALRRKDDDLRHVAFHDALTGLPNRALLLDRMQQRIAAAARQQGSCGVVFIDLDAFKTINDSLGHDAGDALLKETAQRLQASLRATDTVARIGGDEFVVVLGDVQPPETCEGLAEKLLATLALPMTIEGVVMHPSASLGIASFPEDGDNPDELLKRADMAMYEAKSAGRGSYMRFQAAMSTASGQRLQMDADLRHALAAGEFELHYQPKMSLTTNELNGVEALIRWRHPVRGLVSPMEFIPLAEATGLIVPLGDWVLEEACRQSAAWQAQGLGAVKVAVNISARQMQREGFVERFFATTRKHGVAPASLEIELTESVIMANPQNSARILSSLRQQGVTIAMDDFGTGYSSLSYLRQLPLDVLKIDRSFVMNADQDDSAAGIVKMIIALAQALNLQVVAEGVETERQAEMLRRCGCTTAQGYLFAKPLVPAEFAQWAKAAASRGGPAHRVAREEPAPRALAPA